MFQLFRTRLATHTNPNIAPQTRLAAGVIRQALLPVQRYHFHVASASPLAIAPPQVPVGLALTQFVANAAQNGRRELLLAARVHEQNFNFQQDSILKAASLAGNGMLDFVRRLGETSWTQAAQQLADYVLSNKNQDNNNKRRDEQNQSQYQYESQQDEEVTLPKVNGDIGGMPFNSVGELAPLALAVIDDREKSLVPVSPVRTAVDEANKQMKESAQERRRFTPSI